MVKISFLGDIMCEPLMLKAARERDTYDFSGVFENVKALLSESDYVVGNLETPLAGKEAGIVDELFSFNAPDEFATALKNAGVDFVSTANNHCMDRGLEGLKRTIYILDQLEIAHDGTYSECGEYDPFVIEIKGNTISIIPFTYGTNYGDHKRQLPDHRYVNLLHADTDPVYVNTHKKSRLSKIKGFIFKPFKMEKRISIKRALGMEYNRARKDDYLDEDAASQYFQNLKRKINKAKELADVVVFYPHVGGQFNIEPGRFTEYTIKKGCEYGANAIIASHPHIVQKAECREGVPVFYSIGNFSMSPNSVYLLHENFPEIGLIVHLYVEDRSICRTTFSIVKIIENKHSILSVWPVDELYKTLYESERVHLEEEVKRIYQAVAGKGIKEDIIRREYEFCMHKEKIS